MGTSVKDHQPPPSSAMVMTSSGTSALARLGMHLMASRNRQQGDRNGSKADTESAVPPDDDDDDVGPRCQQDGSPDSSARPAPPPPRSRTSFGLPAQDMLDGATAQPRFSMLERIPTYRQPPLPWRDRLLHFTFAWYTVTMSTSGIALIIALTPKRFTGLSTIGLVIFLLDLLTFFIISAAISLRFVLYQDTFRRAFTRPREALFISTFWLSVAAILSNLDEYGRIFLGSSSHPYHNLTRFLNAAFWVYLIITFAFSVIQYHLLFTVKEERRLNVSAMTPAWILPIFPVMLAGTLAGTIARSQPSSQALGILCAGLAAQGLGILLSVFFYSTYLSRLMSFGLPVQRPGMFIAVGPPSFTCSALVAMASEIPRIFRDYSDIAAASSDPFSPFSGLPSQQLSAAAEVTRLLALWTAVFLWGLSFWFFASASVAVIAGMPDKKFHLSWWSFVFPNVGFTLASMRMGRTLGSEGILWFSTVMTCLLVVAWGFIGFRCIRAVYRREIVWPGHDEDSD